MKRLTIFGAGVIAVALAFASSIAGGTVASAGPQLVAGAAHGLLKPHAAGNVRGGTKTANMIFRGGAVMT